MKPKYKIDPNILNLSKDCIYAFKCLYEDIPSCGEVDGSGSVFCPNKNMNGNVCGYRFGTTLEKPLCMCWVREEIYSKYKK